MKSNRLVFFKYLRIFFLLFSRKLVQYCVLKGYLRRVRDYRISLDEPAYMNNNAHTNGNTDGNEIAKTKLNKKTLRELCDGTHDSDSLACLGYSMYPIDVCVNHMIQFLFSIQFSIVTTGAKTFTTINGSIGFVFNTLEMRFLFYSFID